MTASYAGCRGAYPGTRVCAVTRFTRKWRPVETVIRYN
jgi:hypothetical protein